MKPSPSKTSKAAGGKKRAREEAAGSASGTSPPVSPPRPDPNREWKKSKAKTEDLLALLNSGFLREKEGIKLPELLAKIKVLREAGLRAEHVAFSFMKRRVQPLMARDTLGYQYTGDDDTSRMPDDEVDDDIVDRLGRIFKDMPAYTSCPVPEYSAARPPNEVGILRLCRVLITE
jgi:hypothetical protein